MKVTRWTRKLINAFDFSEQVLFNQNGYLAEYCTMWNEDIT